jgi:hypothetical protein
MEPHLRASSAILEPSCCIGSMTLHAEGSKSAEIWRLREPLQVLVASSILVHGFEEGKMKNKLRLVFGAVSFALMCNAPLASADSAIRLRGTIDRVEGEVFVVKSRGGAEVKMVTTEKPQYIGMFKSEISDIKPGQFIGSTAMPQANGTQKAIEVHIFPESMRGLGEGHYDWDLKPKSTMTNANIEQSVAGVDGPVLTVKYKGGEKKLLITPETVVVTFYPGDRADLKPGTKIWAGPALTKQADETLLAPLVIYGRDGIEPPF